MNKISLLAVVGILGLVLCTIHCRNEQGSSEKTDFRLAIADSLISQYNAVRPEKEQFLKTDGKVNLIPGDSIITIEYYPANGEETIIFYLYTKLKYPELKSGPFGQAEVIYLDKYVIVNSLESPNSLFFFISGEAEPNYLRELSNVKMYQGYGLGYRRINKDIPPYAVPYCTCEPNGGREDFCGSGGSGAVSCSTGNTGGSCRISCSGQTFPCCDKKLD